MQTNEVSTDEVFTDEAFTDEASNEEAFTDEVSTESSTQEQISDDFLALLDPRLTCVRERRYPTGIIHNAKPAGIFIPQNTLIFCGWKGTTELVELELSESIVKGLLLSKVNMVIIRSTPAYLVFKNDKEKNPTTAGMLIGWLDDYPDLLRNNRDSVHCCVDRLVYLLNNKNEPFHTKPLKVRWRNVAYWSSQPTLDTFYEAAELAFCQRFKLPPSGMTDEWRSLCVLQASFFAEKTGPVGKRQECCKIKEWRTPTVENIEEWLVSTPKIRDMIWEQFTLSQGFTEAVTKLPLPQKKLASLPPGAAALAKFSL